MSRAAFIAGQKTRHGVPYAVACRALGVSQSWFFKWHHRPPTPAEQRRAEVDQAVAAAFEASKGTYGSPRIHAELRAAGWRVSEKTVAKSMARQGLAGRVKKRRKGLTRPDKRKRPFGDLLNRDFTAPAPNLKWCGDITEIPTDEGKFYLATAPHVAGTSQGRSSTLTAARPIQLMTSPACARNLRLLSRWAGSVHVSTMPQRNRSSRPWNGRCCRVITLALVLRRGKSSRDGSVISTTKPGCIVPAA